MSNSSSNFSGPVYERDSVRQPQAPSSQYTTTHESREPRTVSVITQGSSRSSSGLSRTSGPPVNRQGPTHVDVISLQQGYASAPSEPRDMFHDNFNVTLNSRELILSDLEEEFQCAKSLISISYKLSVHVY